MIKLTETIKLKTKAKMNTGQEFNVFVKPATEFVKGHPQIVIENFENQNYMLGGMLIYHKSGILKKGLIIDGDLICTNIIDILKEIKELLKFNYNIT